MTNNLPTPTLEAAAGAFLCSLAGNNASPQTIRAYTTDVQQFITWLRETNGVIDSADEVRRLDVTEYLAHLAGRGLTGVTRARKLAALREYFRYLESIEVIARSPLAGITTPKREQRGRNYLTPEEYNRLLAAAGGQARDFCILTLFLQTGIRISELCTLTLDDVDPKGRTLQVREGKGQSARTIALEKKGALAVTSWLKVRPDTLGNALFLGRDGQPLKEWGVRDLLAKYCQASGIRKKITPHSLRHTFASYKAERGVSAFQLKEWLGHRKLDTTQIYIHLARQNAKKVMEATSL
jgi:site-specific recombinase XerD